MNPILHKTLALTLSASLLSAYGSPTFAWEHTLVSDEQHYADAAGYNGVSYDGGNGGAFEITKTGNATFENTTLNNNTITKSSRNGGAIYSKGHFAIGDNVTLNGNTATRYGGAIYSEGSGTFGDGVSLSGNKAEMAAGAYLKNNSHTFGKNLSVTDNKATGSAAGIAAYYTNLTIGDNATFANNEATRRGGAINLTGYKPQFWAANIGNNAQFIANKSGEKGGAMNTYLYDVTIGDNATFDKNEAMNAKGTGLGGAIYNTSRSLVIGKGATFSNNKAAQGGAIYQGNDSDLLLTSATFTGNQATGNATQSAGGAIMIDKEDAHDVTINDSAFTENKADVAGGAILQMDGSKATITLNNTTFTDNQAGAEGGAVVSDSTLLVNNSTFTGNKTTSTKVGPTEKGGDTDDGGGAIMMYDESNATITGSTFQKNESGTFGGAISTRGGASSDKSSLKVENSVFEGNKAAKRGGAINATVGATIQNSQFTANESANGGAIMNQNALDVANVTFTNNKATGYGGAMYVNTLKADGTLNDGVTNITDSVFDGNTAYLGGAVFVHNGVANIKNSRFINNTADYSGAIFTGSTPYMVLSIENSLFENNTAKGVGAVQAMSKTTIKNSTFKSNAATEANEDGGAMFVGAVGKVEVDSSVFEGNTSMARGGAIATRSYDLANNKDAALDITNSTFTANKAATTGGALDNFLYNSINAADSVYVANSTFTKNEAADGGAIYNHGELDKNNHAAVITVKDSVFTGNTATNNGGAIYNMAQGVFNLEGNNTFADNTANGVANDIYNDGILNINSGTTTLAGGIAGAGALQVKGSAALNLGQSTAQADSITLDNGASLAVEFANNAMGNLKANTITIGENAEDTVKLTVTLSRDFLTDTTAVSHELTNGTAVTNGSFALADVSNALYQVTMDNNVVTAVRKAQEETQQEIANAGGNANDMNVLNAFTTSTDMGSSAANQTADLINTLAQTDVAGAVQATKAVAPEVASAKQVVHGSITREVFNALQTRMDNVSGNAPKTFALADEQSVSTQGESAVWLQGLLNKSHKEATDTDAFTGRSTGLAFGLDKQLSDALLLGAGYAYTHTNVSSTLRHDRILGDNFFVYGQYRPSRFFVQGSLGYGDSKYEESKYLPGLTVKGDYHVKNYSAQAVAGYEWTEALIPTVGVRYISLQQEGYKDSSDQAISAEQNNYLSGLAGITLKGAYQATANLRLMPQLRAGLSYDFVSDQAQGTVVLPNGSNYAVSGERLHRLGFETGVSVGAYVFENVEALLGYEGNFRQDYASHTGTLKFRYLF